MGWGGGGLCLNPPTDLINGVPYLRRAIISAASWEVQLKNRFHLTIGSGRYYICLRNGLYATFRVDKWKRSTVKMLKFTNCAVSCSGNVGVAGSTVLRTILRNCLKTQLHSLIITFQLIIFGFV